MMKHKKAALQLPLVSITRLTKLKLMMIMIVLMIVMMMIVLTSKMSRAGHNFTMQHLKVYFVFWSVSKIAIDVLEYNIVNYSSIF